MNELENYLCPRQVRTVIRSSTVRTSGHTMMQKFHRLFFSIIYMWALIGCVNNVKTLLVLNHIYIYIYIYIYIKNG